MLAHRPRIPMPRPDLIPPRRGWGMMTGPASRSRLASRCHKSKEQRTGTDRTRPLAPSASSKGRCRTPAIRDLCALGCALGSPTFSDARGPQSRIGRARTRKRLAVACPDAVDRPIFTCACLVGLGRLERPTSRLSGVRSNQLSYRPAQRSKIRDRRSKRRARQPMPGATFLTSDL